MVTSYDPPTHYSRYLTAAIEHATAWKPIAIVERPASVGPPGVTMLRTWAPGPAAFLHAIRAIRRVRPEVVHIQHEITMYGGALSAAVFPLFLLALKLMRQPIVTTVHAVVTPSKVDEEFLRLFGIRNNALMRTLAPRFFALLFRLIGHLSSAIIVHNQTMRSGLLSEYGVAAERIHVIPIGVPTAFGEDRCSPKELEWWRDDLASSPFFLFFGYLVRRKGLEYLIDAFEQFLHAHPEHYLVLAGGVLEYQRPYATALVEQARGTAAADRILFTGFLAPDVLDWLYRRAQAVVLPYAFSMSASAPLAHAFQHGRPILASDLSGLRDDVLEGVNGLLVEPRSVGALAKGLARLADDAKLRAGLASGAAVTARARHWDRCAEATAEIYERVRRPHGRAGR